MNEMQLGIERFNAGRFQESLRFFRNAYARGERGPELRSFMAHALDSLGRPQEAIRAFTAVIEDFPRHLPAYSSLANLMLHRGPLKHERRTLRWILALKPRDAEARRQLVEVLKVCAQAFRAAGDLALAEMALRKLLLLAPSDAQPRGQLIALIRMRAQAHLTAREFEAAEKALRQALALAPGREDSRRQLADLLRMRAHEQMSASKLGPAEKTLRRAVAAAPGDARSRRRLGELLHQRGMTFQSKGRMDDAERSLRAALALQPRDTKSRLRLLELLCQRAQACLGAGKPDLAEKALRRALAFEPRDKEARRRLLDLMRGRAREHLSAGETAKAERALRRALAFAPLDNEARRLLVELLRSRLEAALAADDAARTGSALRAALAFSPRDKEARRRLAELLRARGLAALFARRLRNAERLFKALLLCDPLDSAACLSLAAVMSAAGRPAAQNAMLRRAVGISQGRLGLGDKFKALMKLRRYREAVRTAEAILDSRPALPDIRCFWDPWDWDERIPRKVLLRELRAFERAVGPNARGPWLHYYRGSLSGPDGLPHFERLSGYPVKRYGWMYFRAGSAALLESDFKKAESWFKRSLASKPKDWRAHCFLAETYLCLRKPKAAFAEMDRALRAAPESEAGQVLAWRGAFELWLGRYQRALGLLDKAAALGAQCAHCWKGAALLKLGRPAEALEELDLTLRLYPLDFEAYVWRGEAKRALGRPREALKDLGEHAVKDRTRKTPVWLWARFNRALAMAALEDKAGMNAEFEAIPAPVIAYIRKATGLEKTEDILEAGLRLSRGFRRDEYGQAIWMTEGA
jgi:tetratricopeptide (TPR) repeat protein